MEDKACQESPTVKDRACQVSPSDFCPVNSTSRRGSSISTIPLSSDSEATYPITSASENIDLTRAGQNPRPVDLVKPKATSEEVKPPMGIELKIASAASTLSDYKKKRTLLWVLQSDKGKKLKGDYTTLQLGKN